MGPKPVASEDQTGFSPDDWKRLELNFFYYKLLEPLQNSGALISLV